jgi:hypothetical protein
VLSQAKVVRIKYFLVHGQVGSGSITSEEQPTRTNANKKELFIFINLIYSQ